MDRYMMYVNFGSNWTGAWIDKEIDEDGDWVKASEAFAKIDSLRAKAEALHKVFSAAQNLVNNSYTPSCDGDRQRWLMLKDAINTALRGEGE